MILISVIIGYLLGAIPFLVYFFVTSGITFRKKENPPSDIGSLVDEWINGKKDGTNAMTPNDVYEEYITGEESTKKEIK